MYQKILVAVDGSDHSKRAAEHAAHLASIDSTSVVEVLYILDHERIKGDVIYNIDDDTPHFDQDTRLAPIKEIFEGKGTNYKFTIKHGEPSMGIISFANRGDFDIVIIGSRGLNTFQEMVLGSVSHKVAKRANMPVLIVK